MQEAVIRSAAVGILDRHLAEYSDALTGVTAPACADCGKASRKLGRHYQGRSLCPNCFSTGPLRDLRTMRVPCPPHHCARGRPGASELQTRRGDAPLRDVRSGGRRRRPPS
ncbi:hypothetical protein GCM10010377_56220 [Streptomyces viridiviolaceus]|nr:hypothetical protein GCM10010377_56220 [Streptomyces viridiviolaceus]